MWNFRRRPAPIHGCQAPAHALRSLLSMTHIEDVHLGTGTIVRIRADGPAAVSATYGDRVVGRASWHRLAGPRAEADVFVDGEFARRPLAAHLLVRLARLADAALVPTLVVRAGPAVTAGFGGGTEIRTQDWPEALAALEHAPARWAAPGAVVIAGGGVAGLECLMALRDLEGDDLRIVLVSPADDLAYRPLEVAEPFALGRVRRYPLAPIAADFDAELVRDAVVEVLPGERRAVCESGATLDYGALVLAPGTRPDPPVPHAVTFGAAGSRARLEVLLDDLRAGSCRDVAFLVPPETSWSLPLYELALMTAAEAAGGTRVWLVSPEPRPLAVFGPAVSDDVARILEAADVQFVGSARGVPEPGGVRFDGRLVHADAVVALPALRGPALRGVPADERGFIPTDDHGRVEGLDGVYAAGDATAFPVKQGGLAAQQADAVAEAVAAAFGAPLTPRPFRPVLRGLLLTGGEDRFLRAALGGGEGDGETGGTALWSPPSKVAGLYLAPYLARH
jgi:sulfide:quinone oxidoreductase